MVTSSTWDYTTSPVAWKYKQDRSFGSFIIGPVGSGKSVPSLQRILDLGQEQAPSDDGKPGLLLNKRHCPMLHKGLMGAWHFKRLAVTGEDRYADKPSKNDESHICDGAGYGFLGVGEFDRLGGRRTDGKGGGSFQADGDFDVFA
jgi:hypothetical protein